MRTNNLHELIFETYKAEGKELSLGELRKLIPAASVSREGWRKAIKKCERVYRSRWNEIYDTNLGIVHVNEPEKVQNPEPIQAPAERSLDPLEALKKVRRKREEHE